MLGGRVRWEALSVVGQLGDGLFSRINVQKAFLGAAGFTLESGLADATDEEAQIKRSMVAAAREVIAIVDHTKWERAAFATFCSTSQIDGGDDRRRAPGSMVAALRGTRHRGPLGLRRGSPGRRRRAATTVEVPPMTVTEAVGDRSRARWTGISKRFGATQALDGVSLDLLPGEIHGLVGENGAGKSTLVKILAGVHQPDAGTIRLDGELVELRGPGHARALGIAVVHQEPRLFPDLSVAENVFIGHAPSGRLRTIAWSEMRRQAATLFKELDVRFDVGAPVRGLSMADQQLIEIAKALSVEARVLILDEPTASLSAHEVERLTAIVRGLRDAVSRSCSSATARRGLRPLRSRRRSPRRPPRRHDRDQPADHGRPRAPHGRADGDALSQGRSPIGDVVLEADGLSRAGLPTTSASPSAQARSSAWPGWSERGEPRSPASCSGSIERTPGISGSTASRSPSRARPQRWMRASPIPEDRHQEGLVADFSDRAERDAADPATALSQVADAHLGRTRGSPSTYTAELGVKTTGVDQLVSRALGRQPAEGRARQVAVDRSRAC